MTRSAAVAAVLLIFTSAGSTACRRPAAPFSERNARAHVEMLAGTIGSRPVGSVANARARSYIVDQLRQFGLEVRVQEADGRRAELGRTARVSNIIAESAGSRREAVALVAHYDSAPEAPGATDDALGVSVAIEAARVMAARTSRQWSLMVLLTDGEEAGLMGAAALATERAVIDRVHTYLNLESIGSSGPAHLFETGPGNDWLTARWARSAPHPRGGSYGIEIYRRLPNDTDFSILKQYQIPGLNFAPVGDSYAYHTARDTPERLSSQTIREFGENVVALLEALNGTDITQRSSRDATYFDLGGITAISFGPAMAWLFAIASLLLGGVAALKVVVAAVRMEGSRRWLLTVLWTGFGAALVTLTLIGVTWALRASREVYHPWYAHPNRLFLLLVSTGLAVAWSVGRFGRWIPARLHGVRHPAVTWSIALPVWTVLAALALWFAPAAAYLWLLPLGAAGLALGVTPVANERALRVASALVLAVAASMWVQNTTELLRFIVAVFGRLPVITPIFVYAVVIAAAGVVLVPPFVAIVAARRPLLRPTFVTALCLLAVAVTAVVAYRAPAYTAEEPLRRTVRALQERDDGPAIYEVGSTEPGLDLGSGAPTGWVRATTPVQASVPWGQLSHPFTFRTTGPSLGPPPARITGYRVQRVEAGHQIELSVVPGEPGVALSFVLPEGMTPARSNLPGTMRGNRWVAVYIAPPPDGVAFHASFPDADATRLQDIRVLVTAWRFPAASGWQRLPPWLPEERTVWQASAAWLLPAPAPYPDAVQPVPPLR